MEWSLLFGEHNQWLVRLQTIKFVKTSKFRQFRDIQHKFNLTSDMEIPHTNGQTKYFCLFHRWRHGVTAIFGKFAVSDFVFIELLIYHTALTIPWGICYWLQSGHINSCLYRLYLRSLLNIILQTQFLWYIFPMYWDLFKELQQQMTCNAIIPVIMVLDAMQKPILCD